MVIPTLYPFLWIRCFGVVLIGLLTVLILSLQASEIERLSPAQLIEAKRYGEAIPQLLLLAEAGDVYAQTKLGVLYENGLGINRNLEAAIHWYRTAAEQGHAPAQVNLGVLYQFGTGVTQDFTLARYWYEKASAQDYPRGIGKLAYLYVTGSGGVNDVKRGIALLEKAAAGGYDEALYNLALFLRQQNTTQSRTRSVLLLQRAIEKKYPAAMNELALLHLMGEVRPQNMTLAHQLLSHATALGFKPARKNLAKLCQSSPKLCE